MYNSCSNNLNTGHLHPNINFNVNKSNVHPNVDLNRGDIDCNIYNLDKDFNGLNLYTLNGDCDINNLYNDITYLYNTLLTRLETNKKDNTPSRIDPTSNLNKPIEENFYTPSDYEYTPEVNTNTPCRDYSQLLNNTSHFNTPNSSNTPYRETVLKSEKGNLCDLCSEKELEVNNLLICSNKLEEVNNLLELNDPEKIIKKDGIAWEIDEIYLKKYQLKLKIQDQQNYIKHRLDYLKRQNKLNLSDYYKITHNKNGQFSVHDRGHKSTDEGHSINGGTLQKHFHNEGNVQQQSVCQRKSSSEPEYALDGRDVQHDFNNEREVKRNAQNGHNQNAHKDAQYGREDTVNGRNDEEPFTNEGYSKRNGPSTGSNGTRYGLDETRYEDAVAHNGTNAKAHGNDAGKPVSQGYAEKYRPNDGRALHVEGLFPQSRQEYQRRPLSAGPSIYSRNKFYPRHYLPRRLRLHQGRQSLGGGQCVIYEAQSSPGGKVRREPGNRFRGCLSTAFCGGNALRNRGGESLDWGNTYYDSGGRDYSEDGSQPRTRLQSSDGSKTNSRINSIDGTNTNCDRRQYSTSNEGNPQNEKTGLCLFGATNAKNEGNANEQSCYDEYVQKYSEYGGGRPGRVPNGSGYTTAEGYLQKQPFNERQSIYWGKPVHVAGSSKQGKSLCRGQCLYKSQSNEHEKPLLEGKPFYEDNVHESREVQRRQSFDEGGESLSKGKSSDYRQQTVQNLQFYNDKGANGGFIQSKKGGNKANRDQEEVQNEPIGPPKEGKKHKITGHINKKYFGDSGSCNSLKVYVKGSLKLNPNHTSQSTSTLNDSFQHLNSHFSPFTDTKSQCLNGYNKDRNSQKMSKKDKNSETLKMLTPEELQILREDGKLTLKDDTCYYYYRFKSYKDLLKYKNDKHFDPSLPMPLMPGQDSEENDKDKYLSGCEEVEEDENVQYFMNEDEEYESTEDDYTFRGGELLSENYEYEEEDEDLGQELQQKEEEDKMCKHYYYYKICNNHRKRHGRHGKHHRHRTYSINHINSNELYHHHDHHHNHHNHHHHSHEYDYDQNQNNHKSHTNLKEDEDHKTNKSDDPYNCCKLLSTKSQGIKSIDSNVSTKRSNSEETDQNTKFKRNNSSNLEFNSKDIDHNLNVSNELIYKTRVIYPV